MFSEISLFCGSEFTVRSPFKVRLSFRDHNSPNFPMNHFPNSYYVILNFIEFKLSSFLFLADFMTMKIFAPYAISLAKEVCSKHAQEILFFDFSDQTINSLWLPLSDDGVYCFIHQSHNSSYRVV